MKKDIFISNYIKEFGQIINLVNNKTDKISFIQYVITPKGISERTKLTLNFMKRKMKEYDELKQELSRDRE